jgi:hypothetical protein
MPCLLSTAAPLDSKSTQEQSDVVLLLEYLFRSPPTLWFFYSTMLVLSFERNMPQPYVSFLSVLRLRSCAWTNACWKSIRTIHFIHPPFFEFTTRIHFERMTSTKKIIFETPCLSFPTALQNSRIYDTKYACPDNLREYKSSDIFSSLITIILPLNIMNQNGQRIPSCLLSYVFPKSIQKQHMFSRLSRITPESLQNEYMFSFVSSPKAVHEELHVSSFWSQPVIPNKHMFFCRVSKSTKRRSCISVWTRSQLTFDQVHVREMS